MQYEGGLRLAGRERKVWLFGVEKFIEKRRQTLRTQSNAVVCMYLVKKTNSINIKAESAEPITHCSFAEYSIIGVEVDFASL